MCGIFAYIGDRTNAQEIVLEGLKKLEYRGYDSWGIAHKRADDQTIVLRKQVGKIAEANPELLNNKDETHFAIGHTRWATHGGVTNENAHPHASMNGKTIVIHNGIFENFQELKTFLIEQGYKFQSQTDTEVAAQLIQYEQAQGLDFMQAIKSALKKLHGRYALIIMSSDHKQLVVARRGSPLIIGHNPETNEQFLASDVPAFLKYTNQVYYLDDEQMAILEQDQAIKFFDLNTNSPIEKRLIQIDIQEEEAQKGDHPHFMIKEIWEQKETLLRAVNQDPALIKNLATTIDNAYGTYLIGCGTAGKVCLAATYLFAKIAKKHINFAYGSEFLSFQDFIKPGSLLLAVSQSGETADTLEAMEIAKGKGAKLAAIINVESSTMGRLADLTIPIKAGPEKAVASTKATTSQLAILTLLAYSLADELEQGLELLINTSSQINDMLNPRYEEHIEALARKIYTAESMYIIGKGVNYPMALEAAIKLQEVSYIHAEGFAGGELKHGPLALIDKGTPVIVLAAKDETYIDILNNAQEVKARGGYIIGVSPENQEIFDYWIRVPEVGHASPIINIIPIQILSYHLALLKNNDPDKPRNLAKSVTVK